MNEIGRPETSASWTFVQSSPVVLSTIAQPSSVGSPEAREHQPVARFPDRGRDHVARPELARAAVGRIDVDASAFLRTRAGKHAEIVAQMALAAARSGKRTEEAADRSRVTQLPGVEQQRDLFPLGLFLGRRAQPRPDDGPGYRFRTERNSSRSPLSWSRNVLSGCASPSRNGYFVELLVHRFARVVAERRDSRPARLSRWSATSARRSSPTL